MVSRVVSFFLFVGVVVPLSAQTSLTKTNPPTAVTLPQVLEERLTGVERSLVGLAERMPEEEYSYTPTSGEFKGVRSFAGQIKHTAFVNYVIFSAMLGETAPTDDGSEDGPASIKTKAELLQYLHDSFALGHRAIAAMTEQNATASIKSSSGKSPFTTRLALVVSAIGHCFMHYGELMIYMRTGGIEPPD